jgi:ankyrin repeat protein
MYDIIAMHDHEVYKLLLSEIRKQDSDINIIKDILDYSRIDINNEDQLLIPLIEAVSKNKYEIVEVLLEQPNINPNVSDLIGCTGLIIAVRRKNLQIVKLLLQHPKTDPNQQDINGCSPLMDAITIDDEEIVKVLLEQPDIKVNLQDEVGHTALIIISELVKKDNEKRERMLQYLLERPEINKKLKTVLGRTAWDVASTEIREKFPQLNPDFQ